MTLSFRWKRVDWCLLSLFVVFIALGFHHTAHAQDESSSSTESAVTDDAAPVAKPIDIEEKYTDEEIQTRLTEILSATEWFQNLEIRVQDGVVVLKGETTREELKQRAAELVRNAEGVAVVVNEIKWDKSPNLQNAINLAFESVWTIWEDFLAHSPLLIIGILALLATILINRVVLSIVGRVTKRARFRTSLRDLILQLVSIGVWIVGLLVAAVIVFPGLTPTKALTVLGLGSVAIGFAFKDIFENFFAGILILWKYPFDKGDFVEFENVKGKIEDISIRTTMVRQVDGQLVVVPNATIFKNPVDVLTSLKIRRTTVPVGVSYSTDLGEAQRLLRETLKDCSTVSDQRDIEVFAQEFGASSINFEVTWWCGSTPLEIRESRDEVVRSIKSKFDAANIEIPFPQRTLWMAEKVSIEQA